MGQALRRYYRGATLAAMEEVQTGERRNYFFDHQGTVQCLTDDTGAVTDRFASDAWGVTVKRTGTSINRQWYVGNLGYYRQVDQALDYVRARYATVARGQWVSVDTAPHELLYVYANNRPTRSADVSGQSACDVTPNCCSKEKIDEFFQKTIGFLCQAPTGRSNWIVCDAQEDVAKACQPDRRHCGSIEKILFGLADDCVAHCGGMGGVGGTPAAPWAAVLCCVEKGSTQPKFCARRCCPPNYPPVMRQNPHIRACMWKCLLQHEDRHEQDCKKPLPVPADTQQQVGLDECCPHRIQVQCLYDLYRSVCKFPAPSMGSTLHACLERNKDRCAGAGARRAATRG